MAPCMQNIHSFLSVLDPSYNLIRVKIGGISPECIHLDGVVYAIDLTTIDDDITCTLYKLRACSLQNEKALAFFVQNTCFAKSKCFVDTN